jgi:uncharacterized membrane protein YbhN (UPF0104 family)
MQEILPEQTEDGLSTRKIINILRILGAPLLLVIILLRVDLGEIAATFADIRSLPFIAAILLVPVNFAVLILKWRYLLSASTQVTRGQLIRSVIGGFAFVLAAPGQVGEFSRALFIPGESKLRIVGLVAVDKVTAFGITILASMLSLGLWQSGLIYGPFLIVLGLFIWLVYRPRQVVAAVLKLARKLPLKKKVFHFLEGFRSLSTRRWIILLLMSLVYFCVYALQFYLLLWAFEAVSLKAMVICFPLMMLVNSVPATIGGLGIREGAAVLFFSKFGVQESSALSAALLLFVINILLPGLCGLAFVHHIGAKPKPLPEKDA